MKIKNKTLYIDRTDLDHILGTFELRGLYINPPSNLFLKGLEMELQFNGLEDETFNKIVIEGVWG